MLRMSDREQLSITPLEPDEQADDIELNASVEKGDWVIQVSPQLVTVLAGSFAGEAGGRAKTEAIIRMDSGVLRLNEGLHSSRGSSRLCDR